MAKDYSLLYNGLTLGVETNDPNPIEGLTVQ